VEKDSRPTKFFYRQPHQGGFLLQSCDSLRVPVRLDQVGAQQVQNEPVSFREVWPASVQRDTNYKWRRRRKHERDLMLDSHLSKELRIEAKMVESLRREEV